MRPAGALAPFLKGPRKAPPTAGGAGTGQAC